MPKYTYNEVAPEGWAVDENGKFIKVPEGFVQSGGEFVQGPGSSNMPGGQTGDAKWVDEFYKRYFDRSATDAEKAQWSTANPQDLEGFLKEEQKKYGYTSTEQRAAGDANLRMALDMIDQDPNIPPVMKQYAKDIVQAYGGDAKADFTDIMATFNKLKTETIDPYYASQVNFLQKGFEQSYSMLEKARALEREQEQATAQRNIEGAKEALESRGLTFSGEASKALGAEAAQTVPGMEGRVPQANRLMASSSDLRYQENLGNLGRQAESVLGSGYGGIAGYTPAGSILGSAEEARRQSLGSTLGTLVDTQTTKNALNKTKSLNLSGG